MAGGAPPGRRRSARRRAPPAPRGGRSPSRRRGRRTGTARPSARCRRSRRPRPRPSTRRAFAAPHRRLPQQSDREQHEGGDRDPDREERLAAVDQVDDVVAELAGSASVSPQLSGKAPSTIVQDGDRNQAPRAPPKLRERPARSGSSSSAEREQRGRRTRRSSSVEQPTGALGPRAEIADPGPRAGSVRSGERRLEDQ